LNINIDYIGEQPMPNSTLLRPVGFLFAALLTLTSWVSVVTVPTPDATITMVAIA
jgi:hypothetical protein